LTPVDLADRCRKTAAKGAPNAGPCTRSSATGRRQPGLGDQQRQAGLENWRLPEKHCAPRKPLGPLNNKIVVNEYICM